MTRFLTEEEIENILDFIEPSEYIPAESANAVVENNKNRLRKQLISQKVYPEVIPQLKEEIMNFYYRSLIQSGESVGVICAQSIGEKQTQTTLNTFHKAGMSEKTMTQGVPRFQELINATKKPRIVNHKIYLNYGNKTIEETRNTIGSKIVGLSFPDISNSITINLNKKVEKWYEPFKLLHNDNFSKHKHCITVKLNLQKLFEFKITLNSIADFIHKEYDDLFCVFSPPGIGQIDIFVDTTNIELPEERILFINKNNAEEIYLEECVKPILEKINLMGIHGITELFYTQENEEWIVETNGINSRTISTQYINFKSLLALDIVNEFRTISNNVWDIYEVLGIEAAREFLIEEFMNIMDGINSCHACLLVDRMTFGGNISSITRYTMKKDESGPFGKASFEETMDNFLNAAAKGEVEPTEGVSASIICGKRAKIGTGIMDVKLDFSKLGLCKPIKTNNTSNNVKELVAKKKKNKLKKFTTTDEEDTFASI
jgi:DNA-directed RNA polymerase beta' subunit